jgi:hypothetical protein
LRSPDYHRWAGCAGAMSEEHPQTPASPRGFSRRFVVLIIAIVLFGGSLLLYVGSIGFGFIGYDEGTVLLSHPNLYNQPSLLASLREILVGYFPREEPLIVRDLSWLLDARLFGFENPVGYHLGNVVLNAANVVLLFLFLLHATRSVARASLVAVLFASLAIHVEPVCWAMGRKDLLGAFFTLLALLLQSMALRQPSASKRAVLHVLVFLLVPLAILSKFSAVVLVLLLAVHRLYAPFLAGARGPRETLPVRWRELVWLLPHLAVTGGLYLWYQRTLSAFQVIGDRGPPLLSLTHIKNLAWMIPRSLGGTLGRHLWAGEHSIFYLRPNIALPVTATDVVIIVATVIGSGWALSWALRQRKDLAFFVLGFFIFLLPYFNFEYIGIWGSDRYAYLASLCVVAPLVMLACEAWRRAGVRTFAAIAFAALAIAGAYNLVAGWAHQQAFRNARAFWDYEVGRAEPSMLGFDTYVKTALSEAAAGESGSPARGQAIERATRMAGQGLRYYETQPWQAAPGYFMRERAHAAGLLTSLGLAATLAERPLEERLDYHRLAYRMMPSQRTALMLAQVLFDISRREPRSEARARESLEYFGRYLHEAKSDPLRRRGLFGLLRQYTDAFPALSGEVERIGAENLQ